MKIVEIFPSVQGEGVQIGTPVIFVRTAGCNLQCVHCDTRYAWHGGKEKTAHEIVSEITLLQHKTCAQWVCITGGEPMIQQDLGQVIHAIKAKGSLVSLETNGTLYDEVALEEFDFLSISPKLPSMMTRTGPNIGALQLLAKLPTPMQFKFVVDSTSDTTMIKKVLHKVKPACPIVFQPNGMVSPVRYLSELRWLWEVIQDPEWYGKDIRLIPQLHVMLYGHRQAI